MRTFCAFPLLRTDQYLAVLLALLAMKLVNRHVKRVAEEPASSRSNDCGLRPILCEQAGSSERQIHLTLDFGPKTLISNLE